MEDLLNGDVIFGLQVFRFKDLSVAALPCRRQALVHLFDVLTKNDKVPW